MLKNDWLVIKCWQGNWKYKLFIAEDTVVNVEDTKSPWKVVKN